MSGIYDPRERVMQLGGKLLDVIYRMEISELKPHELIEQLKADPTKIADRGEELIEMMTLGMDYKALASEYTTLRRTIEAMDAAAKAGPLFGDLGNIQ